MNITVDFINEVNDAINLAKSNTASQLANEAKKLVYDIELTKKALSEDDKMVNDVIYEGILGKITKHVGYTLKTAFGLDEYNDLDEELEAKLDKIIESLENLDLASRLEKIASKFGKAEKDYINSLVQDLYEVSIYNTVSLFDWAFSMLQSAIDMQNMSENDGKCKVGEMKKALQTFRKNADILVEKAKIYDNRVAKIQAIS